MLWVPRLSFVRASLIAVPILTLAGCQAAPAPAPVTAPNAPAPAPGVAVRLEHLQSLPLAWSQATVSLYSATVSTAYTAAAHAKTVQFGAGTLTMGYSGGGSPIIGDLAATFNHVAVATDGTCYVVDTTAGKLRKFGSNGVEAGGNFPITGLTQPTSVAVDRQGKAYVTEPTAGNVRIYNGDGSVATTKAGLTSPWGVAVDADLNYYVTQNTLAGSLTKYNPAGNVLKTYAGLDFPGGVAVDASGNGFIGLGGSTHAVVPFDFNGGTGSSVASNADNTYQLAMDVAGNVYMYESNGGAPNLRRFNRAGGSLAAMPLRTTATSLGVNPSTGDLYTVEPGAVYKFGLTSSYAATDIRFLPVRPATDYTARAFLQQGTALLGSAESSGVTLNGGVNNTVPLTITPNGQAATFGVLGGSTVSKVATVPLRTGIQDSLPGVDAVDISIKGNAYPSGAKLAHLTVPGTWSKFDWSPNADNLVAPCDYKASALATNASAQLTFEALTNHGEVVGRTTYAVTVTP
ncbi:MAG: putative cell wall binding repeat-containing protein [Cyanobacteria bacterium RYN_339]|nr:putative cell wall binding repeat-containing protein [Cyanobacteria bacterium RYN_339]